jgi:hypothetical protein
VLLPIGLLRRLPPPLHVKAQALGGHVCLVGRLLCLDFERFLRGPAADAGRDFDVMVEARLKDLAVLHLRRQLEERGATAIP